jgi:hypothetical protein
MIETACRDEIFEWHWLESVRLANDQFDRPERMAVTIPGSPNGSSPVGAQGTGIAFVNLQYKNCLCGCRSLGSRVDRPGDAQQCPG